MSKSLTFVWHKCCEWFSINLKKVVQCKASTVLWHLDRSISGCLYSESEADSLFADHVYKLYVSCQHLSAVPGYGATAHGKLWVSAVRRTSRSRSWGVTGHGCPGCFGKIAWTPVPLQSQCCLKTDVMTVGFLVIFNGNDAVPDQTSSQERCTLRQHSKKPSDPETTACMRVKGQQTAYK